MYRIAQDQARHRTVWIGQEHQVGQLWGVTVEPGERDCGYNNVGCAVTPTVPSLQLLPLEVGETLRGARTMWQARERERPCVRACVRKRGCE